MPTLGDLTVRIGGDDSQYKDTMKSVSDSLKSFASDTFTVAKDLVAGLSAAFTAAGLVDKIWDTNIVGTVKNSILDFTGNVKTEMADMAASVSTSATEMGAGLSSGIAGAFRSMGGAAAEAAPEIAAVGVAAETSTSALAGLWAGLSSAAAGAAGGLVFAGIAAGAIAAGVAILNLVQVTNEQITGQAILAAQTGNSFVDVATFQGAGKGLLDLLGGGQLSADLAQLSQLAAGVTGLDQAISSTFQNSSTQGGIEQLVAAFQALPDPIDRANLAVQLFGKNAAEGLALMNSATVDAVNHANQLATSYDQGTRESLQRITDLWAGFKDLILSPFDFSAIWADLKSGMISAITSIEEPWHTFFVQLESTWHDTIGSINTWLQSHGIVINVVPNYTDLQMQQIMKTFMGNSQTPGSPMAVPSPWDAIAAAGGGATKVFDEATTSLNRMTDSYASLTGGLGAAQAKLHDLQVQFESDKSNLIIANQVVLQQALVDKIQGTKDALDEYTLRVEAMGKAESALGVTDFEKSLVDLQVAFAVLTQNAGMLDYNQLAQATGNFQTAMDKLAESVRGGKTAFDDFGQATFSGPTIGYLASLRKSLDDTAGSVSKAITALNSWHVDSAPIVQTEDDISQLPTVTDLVDQHLKTFQQTMDALSVANLKQNISQLSGIWQAPNQAIITLDGNLNRVAGTIVGTATILNSQGTQSTVQFAEAAKLAADNYLQITKNVAAGTATIHDQSIAYDTWQQAVIRVEGASATLQNRETTLTAAIKEQWAQGLQGNTAQEAGLDAIKLLLSGQLDIYTNIHKEVDNMFSSMASAIATAVFNWKGFGNLVDTVLQSVGQSIIKNVIDTLTKPISIAISAVLTDVLSPVLSPIIKGLTDFLLNTLGIALPTATSAVGGAASGAAAGVGAAGSAAGAAGSAASGAGGIFSGITDALTGSLGSIINVFSGAVSAISNVVSNFQNAHMETLMGEIEVTTRQINNVVGMNGAESIFGYTKASWMDLQVMVNELSDLHNDNAESIATLEQIRDGGIGGGNAPIVSGLGTIADRISELRDAAAQIISTLEQGFNIPSPTAPTSPTVPTTFVNQPVRQIGLVGTAPNSPWTGGGNTGGATVTVNALNPSARGVANGIIQGLREVGVKI